MLKNTCLLSVICFFSIMPLNAANVSFLVVETGLTRESPPSQQSAMWENILLDVFFEAGHIVSNAPMVRLFHKPDEGFLYEVERDYEEAVEGGMQYFVVAVVSHPAPCNVSLRLFGARSQDILLEHTYSGRAYRTSKEEQDSIKDTIRAFAARIR